MSNTMLLIRANKGLNVLEQQGTKMCSNNIEEDIVWLRNRSYSLGPTTHHYISKLV